MRIAIVGLGPSHDDVPWPDWNTWGLPWDGWAPRYDRLFEMHDRSLWERRGPAYVRRMRECDVPVLMQRAHEDIPLSEAYPLEAVASVVGDYFGSSVSYMLALAILEQPSDIGLWGVDLEDAAESYAHQRPNLEYLIGFARGQGIDVHVEGTLLTYGSRDQPNGRRVAYSNRYGWL